MKTENPETKSEPKKKRINLPSKITTDSSLSALTIAFFFIDLMNSNSGQIVQRIFKKNEKDTPILLIENFYDQNGVLEQGVIYQNGEKIVVTSAEAIEKINSRKRGIDYYLNIEETSKELGIDFEKLNNNFKPTFDNSFRRASELLVWTMFLERYFKLDTPQNIINFCFTLVKSIDYLPDMKIIIDDLMKLVGKNWRWKIVWEIARQDEKVRNYWDSQEKRGTAFLEQWKKNCENQARTRWNERKQNIERIGEKSSILRERLATRFNK